MIMRKKSLYYSLRISIKSILYYYTAFKAAQKLRFVWIIVFYFYSTFYSEEKLASKKGLLWFFFDIYMEKPMYKLLIS